MYIELDRQENALLVSREAVGLYQRLVEVLPAAFLQNYRVSLKTLARILQESELPLESDPTMVRALEVLKDLMPEQEKAEE